MLLFLKRLLVQSYLQLKVLFQPVNIWFSAGSISESIQASSKLQRTTCLHPQFLLFVGLWMNSSQRPEEHLLDLRIEVISETGTDICQDKNCKQNSICLSLSHMAA